MTQEEYLEKIKMHYNDVMRQTVRKLLIDLLMGLILLLLISFSLWLIWLTYFRDYFDTGIIDDTKSNLSIHLTTFNNSQPRRFHNAFTPQSRKTESTPFCIMCHEDLPHIASKEKRAFLNAHGYFMACEVCHTKPDDGTAVAYRWTEQETGKIVNERPIKGKYKIAPSAIINGVLVQSKTTANRLFVLEYMQNKKIQDNTLEKAEFDITHKNLIDTPISCIDCHTVEKVPFLPYMELAYSDTRIEELRRIGVAGMIKKYEHFYLPNLTRKTGDL